MIAVCGYTYRFPTFGITIGGMFRFQFLEYWIFLTYISKLSLLCLRLILADGDSD